MLTDQLKLLACILFAAASLTGPLVAAEPQLIIERVGTFGVQLSWLGAEPSFVVQRATFPEQLQTIGTSVGEHWFDVPPPAELTFYRVTSLCGNATLEPGERCDRGSPEESCRVDCPVQSGLPGLVASYEFEESDGQLVLDSSGNEHHGVLVGGATRSAEGKTGNALELDGVSGHADLGIWPVGSDTLTLSFWAFVDDFEVFDARLFARADAAGEYWSVVTTGPRLSFRLATDERNSTLTAAFDEMPAQSWTHVAATYDGSSMALYQNADLVRATSSSGGLAAADAAPTWLGNHPLLSRPFDGRLDHVRIYDRALDAAQILQDMTGSPGIDTVCGDGVHEVGEECDDGGLNSDALADRCRSDCAFPVCGDGVTDAGEQCDDANDVDGDSCSNLCVARVCGDGKVDPAEECDDGNSFDDDRCRNDCTATFCGDSEINGGEECDDGNVTNDDACGNDCLINFCGDGEINGSEECDDGNLDQNDRCRNDCTATFCGDGEINSDEECDDGNPTDDDACGNDCLLPVCGDGQIDTGEECDDGNTIEGDGCSASCLALLSDDFNADSLAAHWTFVDPLSDATLSLSGAGTPNARLSIGVPAGTAHDAWPAGTVTGNDAPRIMQQVDDGDFQVEVKFESSVSLAFQLQGLLIEQDANNWLRFDSNFDGSDWNTLAVRVDQGVGSVRYNSPVAAGPSPELVFLRVTRADFLWTLEHSTDGAVWTQDVTFAAPLTVRRVGVFAGNAMGSASPAHTAVIDYLFETSSRIEPEDGPCGNGVSDPGEECDDGNNSELDGCAADCTIEPCGDGQLDPPEECDDGNLQDGDGCAADCTLEPFCGDGNLDPGERCDDGNAEDGDGCSGVCQLENCGDGLDDRFEECDDGNVVDDDSCGNDCRENFCGDGEPNNGEECDDGNIDELDACGTDCLDNVCGDGQVNNAETCDDGDTLDSGGCSADCSRHDEIPFAYVVVDPSPPRETHVKAVGDIDADGLLDVAVGTAEAGEGLFWYRAPSWQRSTIVAPGVVGFTTDMQLADVDGDDDLDVVVPQGNRIGASVWWYEHPGPAGDPAVDAWTEHFIGNGDAHDIEVADFNDDQRLDVVVRWEFTKLYLQQQDGSWDEFVLSSRGQEGLAVGDIDGDADMDVAINGVWLENPAPAGDTASNFWPERSYASNPPFFSKVALGDLDGDERQDILLAGSEETGWPLVWYRNVDALAGLWEAHEIDADADHFHSLRVADVDLDGDQDVLGAEMHQSSDPDEVRVYYNDFAGLSWYRQVVATTGSHNMRVADMEGDGDVDIVGVNWHGLTPVELWRNELNSATSLDDWTRHVIDDQLPADALFIEAGKLDGDEQIDLAAGAWWYRNPGSANGIWTRSEIGAPLQNVALLDDLDGDGDADLFGTRGVGLSSDNRLAWARNDGLGGFTVLTDLEASGSGDFLQGAVVDDFGQGNQLALSWHNGGGGIQSLLIPADPSLDTWSSTLLSTTTQAEQLSSEDIDRDGDTDLLLGTTWLRNDGTSWTPFALHPIPGEPDRNRLVDMNGDDRLDAVIGYEAVSIPGKLAWYEQPATAEQLWTEHVIATLIGPMSLDVVDMDLDGDPDVVVGEHDTDNPETARILVLENVDGQGLAWAAHLVYLGDEHHDGAQVVDIDGDGDMDIVSIGLTHRRVLLYENRTIANE